MFRDNANLIESGKCYPRMDNVLSESAVLSWVCADSAVASIELLHGPWSRGNPSSSLTCILGSRLSLCCVGLPISYFTLFMQLHKCATSNLYIRWTLPCMCPENRSLRVGPTYAKVLVQIAHMVYNVDVWPAWQLNWHAFVAMWATGWVSLAWIFTWSMKPKSWFKKSMSPESTRSTPSWFRVLFGSQYGTHLSPIRLLVLEGLKEEVMSLRESHLLHAWPQGRHSNIHFLLPRMLCWGNFSCKDFECLDDVIIDFRRKGLFEWRESSRYHAHLQRQRT